MSEETTVVTKEKEPWAMATHNEIDSMGVGALRSYLREGYAAGLLLAQYDSKTVSGFVTFGNKAGLIDAAKCGCIPAGAVVGVQAAAYASASASAAAAPAAPAAPSAPTDALAFVQLAIDKAFADGRAKGVAESEEYTKKLLEETAGKVGRDLEQAQARVKSLEQALQNVSQCQPSVEAGTASDAGGPEAGQQGGATQSASALPKQSDVLPVIRGHHQFTIPREDKYYVIPSNHTQIIDAALDRTNERGVPAGILFVGPKGCGKSTLPEQWAFRNSRPFFKVNAALLREAKEWFGTKSVLNANLYFIMLAQISTPGAI